MLSELESYLQANLLGLEEEGEPKSVEQDRVKSRMLDAFVEERLLLAEAGRRGLQVEDWEVDAYLALDEPDEEGAGKAIAERQELARQRLLVQMLREGTILGLPPLQEDEVRRYAAKHGERLLSGRRLQLRALLLNLGIPDSTARVMPPISSTSAINLRACSTNSLVRLST